MTDPYGRVTQFFYDGADRLIRTVAPDSSEVLFSYDRNGNMLSLTPPGKPDHTFDYSPVDLETIYTPPFAGDSARATSRTYTLDKEVTRIARPDSLNLSFLYGGQNSLAGQPKMILYDQGQVTYLFDTAKGLITGIVSPNGDSLLYTYEGQLPKMARWTGSVNGSIVAAYNSDLKVTTETIKPAVGSVDSVNFGYDRDGLLTSAGLLKLRSSSINSMLLSDTIGNVVTNYEYDVLGELIGQRTTYGSTALYQVSYVRDSLGRITEKNETIQAVRTKLDYIYDAGGRLRQVSRNATLVSTYTYDSNGNRLALITPGDTTQGVYDAQDRLLSYGTFSYVYSANGDLRMKISPNGTGGIDTTRYVYDAMGNLLSVTLPSGQQITYVADGGGRRIVRKVDGQITNRWLYSDELRITTELDSAGNVLSHFVYATKQNVPEYVLRGGIAYRVVTDQLGSVREVVNSITGEIMQRMDYDEFGNVINSIGQQIVPMGFAGGLYDQQTGLVRFGARDYDPNIGRWTVKDPMRFHSKSTNHYVYAGNDPLQLSDGSGGAAEPSLTMGLGYQVNMGQALSAATIFAATMDMIGIIDKVIADRGKVDIRDLASLSMDVYGINAGATNFGRFSYQEHPREMETNGIQAVAKQIGLNEGLCDLSEAVGAGLLLGTLSHATIIGPKFQRIVYAMNVSMAVYAGVKVLWNLDDY